MHAAARQRYYNRGKSDDTAGDDTLIWLLGFSCTLFGFFALAVLVAIGIISWGHYVLIPILGAMAFVAWILSQPAPTSKADSAIKESVAINRRQLRK